jgi:hypothetical protein
MLAYFAASTTRGSSGYTYNIDTAVSRDGNDRVKGTEINTDDRHLRGGIESGICGGNGGVGKVSKSLVGVYLRLIELIDR